MMSANIDQSYAFYRQQYDGLPSQSMETEGIADIALFAAALEDPRSVCVSIGEDITVPVITPLDNLPYFKKDVYLQRAEGGGEIPLYYYSHLPQLFDAYPRAYPAIVGAGLRRIAEQNGVLAYDHPASRAEHTEAQLTALVTAVGGIACRELIAEGELQHFHWVTKAQLPNASEISLKPIDLPDLYQQAMADGVISSHQTLSVEAQLDDQDIAHVWAFYGPTHERMADTIEAGFSEAEFAAYLRHPAYPKLVYRNGAGEIVHMSIAAEVHDCPWLNSGYFRHNHQREYEAQRVVCGIGAITDTSAERSYALSVYTLGMIGKLVAYAGGEAVFAFACDDQSNAYAPGLTRRALARSGLGFTLDRPVDRQTFHAVQLSPAEK